MRLVEICEMVRLKNIKMTGQEFIAFHNVNAQSVDYFCKSNEYKDVECWSVGLNTFKEILQKDNLHVDDLRKNVDKVLVLLFSQKIKEDDFSMQTFPSDFWENCVLQDFKD